MKLIFIFFLVAVVSILLPVVFTWCNSQWPEQLDKVGNFIGNFIWGVLQIITKSQLLGVGVGALLTYWFSERITDLQHRPAFVSESLAFVVEFTSFYDQQSRNFRAVADLNAFYDLSPPQRKAFMEESRTKLSTVEKQTDLLEFKATRYFHGTDWLAKFEEIHEIWSLGATTTSDWYNWYNSQEEKAFGGAIRRDFADQLSKASNQLSEKTAELLKRFALLLKKLPPESSFFEHVPNPTPTPKLDPNSPE